MRVGPSKATVRGRLETTTRCGGKDPGGGGLGKRGTPVRQVRFRETSASEPLMKCRKVQDDVETRGNSLTCRAKAAPPSLIGEGASDKGAPKPPALRGATPERSDLAVRKPKKRWPFQLVPVIALATCDR